MGRLLRRCGTDAASIIEEAARISKLGCAIEDQITRSGVAGECVAQLLNHPGTMWVFGRVEVENPPPIMRNNEEADSSD
jgi:hypothetical protein